MMLRLGALAVLLGAAWGLQVQDPGHYRQRLKKLGNELETLKAKNATAAAAANAVTADQRRAAAVRKGSVARTAPCACQSASPAWRKPTRTQPECLFVDLGAADGETYKVFRGQSSKWNFNYDTGGFDKGSCYSYLVEANPRFHKTLESLRTAKVYPMTSVAAYMCDKEDETFYVDVSDPNGWGSSLNSTHASVENTNKPVKVRLMNLMRLLTENSIPEDTVVVKMDIEGAEWDILPCLAKSPALRLIDTLYLENHCEGDRWCPTTGQAGNTMAEWESALAAIQKAGVKMPHYWSPMM